MLTAIMPIRKFDDERRVFMVTKKGISKMVMLSAFSRPTARGIIAIKLDDGDELIGVKPIHGGEQVVIATKNGYAIRFPENEVRVMGRSARGVKAITFRSKNDEVIGMEVFSRSTGEETQDMQVTENGEVIMIDEQQEMVAEIETVKSDEPNDGEVEEIVDEGIAPDEDLSDIPEDDSKYEGTLL